MASLGIGDGSTPVSTSQTSPLPRQSSLAPPLSPPYLEAAPKGLCVSFGLHMDSDRAWPALKLEIGAKTQEKLRVDKNGAKFKPGKHS